VSSVVLPDVWAVVPVKHLSKAKSRLAPVLNGASREQLVLTMFCHTLDVLAATSGLAGTAVIRADRRVGEIARGHEALFLQEPEARGLNAALAHAVAELKAHNVQGLLVVPGDLPRLSSESIASALSLLSAPGMVITPDRRGQGTNLLLLAPPDLVPLCFGRRSFQRFLDAAARRGLDPTVFRSVELANDLDVPADLVLARGLDGWSR
jgi:2-phospho-L-lactate guanylyltransferase